MNKKDLLFSVTKKDFKLHWFSGTGAGGQSRNKNQNCLRLSHPNSGASGTGQSNKSRIANQKEAFNTLIKSYLFRLWLNKQIVHALGEESIEEKVEKQMHPKNLRIEGKKDGKWKQVEA